MSAWGGARQHRLSAVGQPVKHAGHECVTPRAPIRSCQSINQTSSVHCVSQAFAQLGEWLIQSKAFPRKFDLVQNEAIAPHGHPGQPASPPTKCQSAKEAPRRRQGGACNAPCNLPSLLIHPDSGGALRVCPALQEPRRQVSMPAFTGCMQGSQCGAAARINQLRARGWVWRWGRGGMSRHMFARNLLTYGHLRTHALQLVNVCVQCRQPVQEEPGLRCGAPSGRQACAAMGLPW